jgi:Ca2+-binding RTX toxin-like protein
VRRHTAEGDKEVVMKGKTLVIGVIATAILALGAGTAFGVQTIIGTPGDDTIYGDQNGPSGDVIYGKGGNDTLYGLEGTDTLIGNRGNDTLYGGRAADMLRGGGGDDTLYGGPDNTKPRRTDEYFCGRGDDTIHTPKGENSVHDFAHGCEHIIRNH